MFRGGGPDAESTVPVLVCIGLVRLTIFRKTLLIQSHFFQDVANRTIAGIPVPNLNQKLPPHLHKEVEEALAKMNFTIKYKKGPKWEEGTMSQEVDEK